jgi:glycosyltransferase involved in cell wall biosynthesis
VRLHTIIYNAASPRIGGGIRVAMDLMHNLDPSRFRSVLVAPGPGPLVDWARQHGVPFEIARDGDWQGFAGLARRSVRLAHVILRHNASIVHAVGPTAYRALGVAGTATRAVRVCHLGFPPAPGELERSFVAGPDAVVACYEAQAVENRDRIRGIRPACQLVAVPNGVDTTRFAPGPPSDAVAALRGNASSVVAILGHVSRVKGYPTFLEAAALVARAHPTCLFLCLGGESAEPGALAEMKARALELGLGDNLRFLGFRNDVHDVLRIADVVTLPSLDEGLPLALLEAMACGRAVIATPVGGIPDVLGDGSAGLLIPRHDAQALAAAIRELLDNPRRCSEMGHKARARVESRYSVPRFAAAVQALYEELLAIRSPRTRLKRVAPV